MMGGQGGGALFTLVERKSRFTRIEPVDSKHADHVAQMLIYALRDHRQQVYTLTMDNRDEFAKHQKVKKALRTDVYFTRPYSAAQRKYQRPLTAILSFLKALSLKR
jgi:IS30 family transposase